jgi:hypothetical protein
MTASVVAGVSVTVSVRMRMRMSVSVSVRVRGSEPPSNSAQRCEAFDYSNGCTCLLPAGQVHGSSTAQPVWQHAPTAVRADAALGCSALHSTLHKQADLGVLLTALHVLLSHRAMRRAMHITPHAALTGCCTVRPS